jgi:polyisoprenoid-binding protein YceI
MIVYLSKKSDMEYLNEIGFGVLALTALVFAWKKNNHFNGLLAFFFASLVLLFLAPGFSSETNGENGNLLIAFGISILAVNWILSQLIHQKWRIFIPFLTSLSFLYFGGKQFIFDEYELFFSKSDALLLPIIGAILPVLMYWKASFLCKFLGVKEADLARVISAFGLGILILTGFVFGQWFGIALIGIGYLSSHFYLKSEHELRFSTSLALFAVVFVAHHIHQTGLSTEVILHGATLIGFFTGMATVGILSIYSFSTEKRSVFGQLILVFIPLLASMAFIFSEVMKEHTGGISAWMGIVLALAMGSFWIKKLHENTYLFYLSISVVIGLIAAPFFKPNAALEMKNPKLDVVKSSSSGEESNILALEGIDLSTVTGDWKINSKSSKVSFELGPKGTRTKGLFEAIEGKISIQDPLDQTKFEIVLPLLGLTTFNDYRDQSLMSAAYFDAPKYPTITFKSNSIEQKNDVYVLTGDFTMRGITKSMQIQLKAAASGEENGKQYLILVGKSSVDRTAHGMTPDAKIGNVVDFEFEVELSK